MTRADPTKWGWILRGGGAALASTLIIALSGSSAWADSASDSRATATLSDNVTTCSGVGLSSDTLVGSSSNTNASDAHVAGTVATNAGSVQPGTGQELDVSITGSGVVIDAVVVKGGNGYNDYSNPAYLPPTLPSPQHFISPFNNGGNISTISHWFVCYHIGPGATTPEVPMAIALPIAGGGIFGTFWLVYRRRRNGPLAS